MVTRVDLAVSRGDFLCPTATRVSHARCLHCLVGRGANGGEGGEGNLWPLRGERDGTT